VQAEPAGVVNQRFQLIREQAAAAGLPVRHLVVMAATELAEQSAATAAVAAVAHQP
jgi:hypothetical protein